MRRTRHIVASCAFAASFVSACAPNLDEEFPFDGALPAGERIIHEELGEGVTQTRVDASAKEAWIYFDLDAKKELTADQAFESNAWDLAFQRFKIITNSGVSGTSEMGTAVIEGGDFDALLSAPAAEYLQDRSDGPDANAEVDSPFLEGDGWYAYDLSQHRLAPRDVLYVVRTAEGAHFAIQLLAYYDDAGTAGHLRFRWKPLTAP